VVIQNVIGSLNGLVTASPYLQGMRIARSYVELVLLPEPFLVTSRKCSVVISAHGKSLHCRGQKASGPGSYQAFVGARKGGLQPFHIVNGVGPYNRAPRIFFQKITAACQQRYNREKCYFFHAYPVHVCLVNDD